MRIIIEIIHPPDQQVAVHPQTLEVQIHISVYKSTLEAERTKKLIKLSPPAACCPHTKLAEKLMVCQKGGYPFG
jgi:hypothetical protein